MRKQLYSVVARVFGAIEHELACVRRWAEWHARRDEPADPVQDSRGDFGRMVREQMRGRDGK